MAEQNEENKKTIVSFVVGLLIGVLLMWTFGGNSASAPADEVIETETEVEAPDEVENTEAEVSDTDTPANTPAPVATLPTGDGSVTVADQEASTRIALTAATFPVAEGWIGVRDYTNEQLGSILGVARFSESQGLVPNEITLQRATTPGNTYAIVFYTEDGDRTFNLATDVQIDGVFATFTAQ